MDLIPKQIPFQIAWIASTRGGLTFLLVDTRTPYVAYYSDENGGQTAHYLLRWVGTTGEKGPWSKTASATIGA